MVHRLSIHSHSRIASCVSLCSKIQLKRYDLGRETTEVSNKLFDVLMTLMHREQPKLLTPLVVATCDAVH